MDSVSFAHKRPPPPPPPPPPPFSYYYGSATTFAVFCIPVVVLKRSGFAILS